MEIEDFPLRVLATVEGLAASRGDGALLVLEAQQVSLERLRRDGASAEELGSLLSQAWAVAVAALPEASWARTLWNRLECALPGQRAELVPAAQALVRGLRQQPELQELHWRAVLTRVFPGEALRTLYCDPEYDLARIQCSLVAWVEPYAGDDWQESQRHPTTAILWRSD